MDRSTDEDDMLHITVKKKKKSKHKKNENGISNEEAAHPEAELKENNHQKKNNRYEEKNEGSYDESFKKTEDTVGGYKSVESLEINQAAKELHNEGMVETARKKKRKKDDRSEKVTRSSSKEEVAYGKDLDVYMEEELGGNREITEAEKELNDDGKVESMEKKKKEKKKTKKVATSSSNEEVINGVGMKSKKKNKDKKGSDVECLKTKRSEEEDIFAEEVESEEAPDGTKDFRGEKNVVSLDMSVDEIGLDHGAKLDKDKKKKRKKDVGEKKDMGDKGKVGMSLNSEEMLHGEELGNCISTKELNSKLEERCDDAVDMEGCIVKEKKKDRIKRKEKTSTAAECLKTKFSDKTFAKENENIMSNQHPISPTGNVGRGSDIKLGHSKEKKTEKKSKKVISDSEKATDAEESTYLEEHSNSGHSKEKKTEKKSKKGIRDSEKATDAEKTVCANKEVTYLEEHSNSVKKKKRCRDDEEEHHKKTKKAKLVKSVDLGETRTTSVEEIVDHSTPSETKKSSKKVKFSDKTEVFALHEENQDRQLVRGKRFSKEEDAMVKLAVLKYIEEHSLGEDGLKMVLNSKRHPEVKNCWKEINASLPWRPQKAVYDRAHSLFERSENREWTSENKELVKEWHEKEGPDWRKLADELGTFRIHVKDLWRRIKLPDAKKGQWSQEEYQTLFDLVNKDLQMKVHEEKLSKHGMLRDNIPWEAISTKLSTRTNAQCCMKWYRQMQSALVKEGKWSDADDYRLMNALLDIDVSCEEDVDWDNLLDHRPGDVCHKRWKQMVNHLGHHGFKSFPDQVEVLSQRYCPHLLEAREAFDDKVPVDIEIPADNEVLVS